MVVAGDRETVPDVSDSTGEFGVDVVSEACELGMYRCVLHAGRDGRPESIEGELEGLTGKDCCGAWPDTGQLGGSILNHGSSQIDQRIRLRAVGCLSHGVPRFSASDSEREIRPLRSAPLPAPECVILLQSRTVSAAQGPNLLFSVP